jgi:hypothetical protein
LEKNHRNIVAKETPNSRNDEPPYENTMSNSTTRKKRILEETSLEKGEGPYTEVVATTPESNSLRENKRRKQKGIGWCKKKVVGSPVV